MTDLVQDPWYFGFLVWCCELCDGATDGTTSLSTLDQALSEAFYVYWLIQFPYVSVTQHYFPRLMCGEIIMVPVKMEVGDGNWI